MKQLLPGYSPLTFSWGFLEAPLEVVAKFFEAWSQRVSQGAHAKAVTGRIEQLLQMLEPLTLPPSRDLLVETRSTWTAFFDNSARGADAASPISYSARELRCRGLAVRCVPDTLQGQLGTYGSVQFELFSPTNTEFLNYERSVAAANDGGKWTFVASGRVQPFEETEQYKKRKIVERFTADILERYAQALGIDLFSLEFYGPSAYLVTKRAPKPLVTLTLEEARSNLSVRSEP